MRPSKFTQSQIVQALERVRAGTTAVAVCRSLGITQTTFYRWRARHDAELGGDARRVRELMEENRKLKQIVADLLLQRQGVEESRPPRRR